MTHKLILDEAIGFKTAIDCLGNYGDYMGKDFSEPYEFLKSEYNKIYGFKLKPNSWSGYYKEEKCRHKDIAVNTTNGERMCNDCGAKIKPEEPKHEQWEYHRCNEDELNNFGKEGWECYAVRSAGIPGNHFLKRRKLKGMYWV